MPHRRHHQRMKMALAGMMFIFGVDRLDRLERLCRLCKLCRPDKGL